MRIDDDQMALTTFPHYMYISNQSCTLHYTTTACQRSVRHPRGPAGELPVQP